MNVLEVGHKYELRHLESNGVEVLTFIKRSSDAVEYTEGDHPGTNTQEVLRALIDRTLWLDFVIPCTETRDAAWHLRQALYLYEVRAWRRKQAKLNKRAGAHDDGEAPNVHRDGYDGVPFNEQDIETRPVGPDGHLVL